MKRCSACKKTKTFDNFTKDKSRRDGFYIYCKPCLSERLSVTYYANRDIRLAKRKVAYHEDPKKILDKQKKYYLANREAVLARQKSRRTYEESRGQSLRKFWPGSTSEQALAKYSEFLVSQNSLCAICKKPETAPDPVTKKTKALSVDHCHDSGKVRGLLCSKCNFGIGYFDDNTEYLTNAIGYLCA